MAGHQASFNRTASPDDLLAPGLLRVLQQAAALRLVFVVVMFVLVRPNVPLWPMHLTMLECLLLLALVAIPRLRHGMGRHFLPSALIWLLIFPLLEIAMFALATNGRIQSPYGLFPLERHDPPEIWLAILLVVWQYGRWGLRMCLRLLVIGSLLISLLLLSHLEILGSYLLTSLIRVAMMGMLGYVVVAFLEQQQAQRRELQSALRQLAQRAATVEQLAESRERNRLAREFHDTLAHSLTGLSVQLQALEMLMTADPQAAQVQIKGVQATVRSGIKEVRRSILALRASPLEDLGLAEALRQLCHTSAERTGIVYDGAIDNVPSVDPLTEQVVYRVAVAALANTEQHAAATRVAVSLQIRQGQGLVLDIRDDGVGFDPSCVPSDRLGLAGMMERAANIGAQLQIKSAPGEGTHIQLAIDVNPVAEGVTDDTAAHRR